MLEKPKLSVAELNALFEQEDPSLLSDTSIKRSTAKIGIPISEEHKEALSRARQGKKMPEEFKKKCRDRMLGYKHTEEAKKKIGDNNRIRAKPVVSEETREKMREASSKRRHTPEEIEKMRIGNLGKKRSPEFCTKMKNRVFTEETREKMSIAARNRLAVIACVVCRKLCKGHGAFTSHQKSCQRKKEQK